jgi:hypothetical protein
MHQRPIRAPRGLILLTGAWAMLALTACDGENLFNASGSGPGSDRRAPTVEIVQPRAESALPLGDSLFVQALVRDDAGIDSVRFEGFAIRGSRELGTEEVVTRFEPKLVALAPGATRDTLLTRFLTAVPSDLRETARVAVTAWDRSGNQSADTIPLIIGGPEVRFLNVQQGQSVVAGQSRNVRVLLRDPVGVARLEVQVSGVFQTSIIRNFNPAVDSFVVDTTFVVPSGISGAITIAARAVNVEGNAGGDGPLNLSVVPVGVADQRAPRVQVQLTSPDRLELGDFLSVQVTGQDEDGGSGVVRAGFTALAISQLRQDTLSITEERTFSPARTGTLTQGFQFQPFNVDSLSLPDTLIYEVTGYMVDQAGNCGAGVRPDTLLSNPCVASSVGGLVAQGLQGNRLTRPVVAGRTVRLPAGGLVQDAAVDTVRRTLLLANTNRNQVEVFRLQQESFASPIGAGSRPWGLSINRTGDTLLVANSGGTDISNIYLGDVNGLGAREDNGRRLLTPDVTLWDVQRTSEEQGVTFEVFVLPFLGSNGFSDRPQYIAQDSTGRLVYSTVTSPGAGRGTVRKAFTPPGGETDVVMLFEHARFTKADEFIAMANLDGFDFDVVSVPGPPDPDGNPGPSESRLSVELFDHVPGFLDQILVGTGIGDNAILDAYVDIRSQGSDAFVGLGVRWNMNEVGFEDTTYVAASGDGGWVVVGEGARDPLGRILMYNAGQDRVSAVVPVTDILTNAGERVLGVGLNNDGTLGVARGFDAYFFNPDLRLRGLAELPAGGAGAVLHPLHANFPSIGNPGGRYEPNTHLAFLGTGEGTIDVIDTFRFRRLGRLFIRDVVTGPLRAVLPFPEDNVGRTCQSLAVFNRAGRNLGSAIRIYQDQDGQLPYPAVGGATDDECIVLKLFGITSGGGVVVVDVRKGDIVRDHPLRN